MNGTVANNLDWTKNGKMRFIVFSCVFFLWAAAPICAQTQFRTEVAFRIDGWEHGLTRIYLLAPGPNEQIAFPHDQQILVFDSAGEPVSAFGREGSGPGEFRAISSIGWRGDSVWAMDGRQGRFTVGLPGDTECNVYQTPMILHGVQGLVYPKGYSSDGTILAISMGEQWDIRRLDLSAEWSEVVLQWTPLPSYPPIPVGNVQIMLRYPFEPEVQLAFAADGSSAAVSVPRGVDEGVVRARLARVRSDGTVLFDREIQVPATPISPAVAKARLEARAQGLEEAHRPAYIRHDRTPDHYPAIADLVLDRDGWTWARSPVGGDEWEYRAFDSEGVLVGSLRLSESQQLMGAQGSRLWVVELDDYDVPSILGLRILPRRPSS